MEANVFKNSTNLAIGAWGFVGNNTVISMKRQLMLWITYSRACLGRILMPLLRVQLPYYITKVVSLPRLNGSEHNPFAITHALGHSCIVWIHFMSFSPRPIRFVFPTYALIPPDQRSVLCVVPWPLRLLRMSQSTVWHSAGVVVLRTLYEPCLIWADNAGWDSLKSAGQYFS